MKKSRNSSKEKGSSIPSFFPVLPRWRLPYFLIWFGFAAAVFYSYYVLTDSNAEFLLRIFPPPAYWVQILPPLHLMELSTFMSHAFVFLKLVFFILFTSGIGRTVIKKFPAAAELNAWESFSLCFALGLFLFGHLMLLLGLIKLYSFTIMAGISFFLMAFSLWENRDLFSSRSSLAKNLASGIPAGFSGKFLALFVVALFALYGFYALAPELFYDSLVYHLALPGLYRSSGGWVPTPTNLYSGIPMHMESLYTWALFFSDERLAKLIHWCCGLGLASGMIGFGLRTAKPLTGWLACLIFFSSPLVGINIHKSAIEVGSAYGYFSAVFCLILYWREMETRNDPFFLYLSAVFAGWAMCMKYTNWPILLVLIVVLLFLRAPFKHVMRYGIISCVAVLPWLIKNIYFYQNPIFPFLHDLIQPAADYPVFWRSLSGDAWGRDWSYILSKKIEIWRTIAHPWYLTMEGRSDADYLGPIFLMLFPALVFFRGQGKSAKLMPWIITGLWLLWWPISRMPRFFIPTLGLISLWIAVAAQSFDKVWIRRPVMVLIFLFSLNNSFWVFAILARMDSWPALLGKETRAEYLKVGHPTYPTPYFTAAEWINANVPAQSKVLVIGDARGFYIERPFVTSSVWDTNYFEFWVRKSRSADELYENLKREGITHVLLNMGEMMRLNKEISFGTDQLPMLELFFKKFTEEAFALQANDPRTYSWNLVYTLSATPAHSPAKAYPLLDWYRKKFSEPA